jgi:hypothetical protein
MRKKLAWFDKPNMKGKIHVHPEVRKEPERARRIRAHMKKAQEVYASTGNRKKAIREGLKAEHEGMTPRRIRRYELENARIARRISGEKPRIPLKTQVTIKRYVRQGYSANEIQRKMKTEKRGIRRQLLLAYVREYKRKPPPRYPKKYVPIKYRRARRVEIQGRGPKAIQIYGIYHGRARRVRRRGTGKSLYRWVKKQKERGLWDEIFEVES